MVGYGSHTKGVAPNRRRRVRKKAVTKARLKNVGQKRKTHKTRGKIIKNRRAGSYRGGPI